jgi:hypothetical protein
MEVVLLALFGARATLKAAMAFAGITLSLQLAPASVLLDRPVVSMA